MLALLSSCQNRNRCETRLMNYLESAMSSSVPFLMKARKCIRFYMYMFYIQISRIRISWRTFCNGDNELVMRWWCKRPSNCAPVEDVMLTIAWKSLMICKHSNTRTHTHTVWAYMCHVCGCVSHYFVIITQRFQLGKPKDTTITTSTIDYMLCICRHSVTPHPSPHFLAHHIQFSVHNFHIFRFAMSCSSCGCPRCAVPRLQFVANLWKVLHIYRSFSVFFAFSL